MTLRNILVFPLALLVRVPLTLLGLGFLRLGNKMYQWSRKIPAIKLK
jgi:hypothetical protein